MVFNTVFNTVNVQGRVVARTLVISSSEEEKEADLPQQVGLEDVVDQLLAIIDTPTLGGYCIKLQQLMMRISTPQRK